jgi:hypothetical protein
MLSPTELALTYGTAGLGATAGSDAIEATQVARNTEKQALQRPGVQSALKYAETRNPIELNDVTKATRLTPAVRSTLDAVRAKQEGFTLAEEIGGILGLAGERSAMTEGIAKNFYDKAPTVLKADLLDGATDISSIYAKVGDKLDDIFDLKDRAIRDVGDIVTVPFNPESLEKLQEADQFISSLSRHPSTQNIAKTLQQWKQKLESVGQKKKYSDSQWVNKEFPNPTIGQGLTVKEIDDLIKTNNWFRRKVLGEFDAATMAAGERGIESIGEAEKINALLGSFGDDLKGLIAPIIPDYAKWSEEIGGYEAVKDAITRSMWGTRYDISDLPGRRLSQAMREGRTPSFEEATNPLKLAYQTVANRIIGTQGIDQGARILQVAANQNERRAMAMSQAMQLRNMGPEAYNVANVPGTSVAGNAMRRIAIETGALAGGALGGGAGGTLGRNTESFVRDPAGSAQRAFQSMVTNIHPQIAAAFADNLQGLLSDPYAPDSEKEAVAKQLTMIAPQAFDPAPEGYRSYWNGKLNDPMEISQHLENAMALSPAERASVVGPLLSQRKYVPIAIGKQENLNKQSSATSIANSPDINQVFSAFDMTSNADGSYELEDRMKSSVMNRALAQEED